MKFLDILDNKIDYLFKRGKNADERTFDFFLRTVTFLILALIILCYGSFVHAEGNTLISFYNIDISKLVSPPVIKWNHADVNKFMNIKMNTEGLEYRNLPSGGGTIEDILYISGMPDLNTNYVLIEQTSGQWEEIWFIPKSYIDSGQMVLVADGEDTRIYSSVDYTFTLFSVNYVDTSDTTKYREYNIRSVSAGNSICPGQFEPAWTYHATWSNAPYYLTSSNYSYSDIETWVNNGMIEDYPNIYNSNYYTFMDGLLEQPWDNSNVETTANNLSLDKFEIVLSGSKSPIGINQANVLIGVSTENNFILNNIDKYDLKVTYSFGVTGNGIQSFVGSKQFTYPLATFTNDVFQYSILELSRDIKVNNQSFMDYYFDVLGSHEIVIQNNPIKNYNGAIPTLINKLYEVYIGQYSVQSVSNISLVQDAYFTVDIVLMDKDGNTSLHGTKVFNLKDGTSSVTQAGILQNQNPWEGDPTYSESPFPNSVGSSSNGSVIQNNNQSNNQTVNIYNGVNPNDITDSPSDDDYNNTIDNMKDIFDEFRNGLGVINEASVNSETGQPNGFLGLLQSTYSFIPGMEYFIMGISVIVALCIILFILKVLLF